jgi:hypothetical protein
LQRAGVGDGLPAVQEAALEVYGETARLPEELQRPCARGHDVVLAAADPPRLAEGRELG